MKTSKKRGSSPAFACGSECGFGCVARGSGPLPKEPVVVRAKRAGRLSRRYCATRQTGEAETCGPRIRGAIVPFVKGRCQSRPVLMVLLSLLLAGYVPAASAAKHPCMSATQPGQPIAHEPENGEGGPDHDCCEQMAGESPGSTVNPEDAPSCSAMCPFSAACKSGSSTLSVRPVARVPDPRVSSRIFVVRAGPDLPALQPADVWHPPRFV